MRKAKLHPGLLEHSVPEGVAGLSELALQRTGTCPPHPRPCAAPWGFHSMEGLSGHQETARQPPPGQAGWAPHTVSGAPSQDRGQPRGVFMEGFLLPLDMDETELREAVPRPPRQVRFPGAPAAAEANCQGPEPGFAAGALRPLHTFPAPSLSTLSSKS